jgi:hypothetical protein
VCQVYTDDKRKAGEVFDLFLWQKVGQRCVIGSDDRLPFAHFLSSKAEENFIFLQREREALEKESSNRDPDNCLAVAADIEVKCS